MAGRQAGGETEGDLLEKAVSYAVAHGVVQGLEVVQIDVEEGTHRFAGGGGEKCLGGRPGVACVEREVVEAGFFGFAVRYVAEVDGHSVEPGKAAEVVPE